MSIMPELFKSLEWPRSLFELALSENPTWRPVPELYFSQMIFVGGCLCVHTHVRQVHRLLVFDYAHLGCYLSYWCGINHMCSLVKCLELSVGVNLTSVLDSLISILISVFFYIYIYFFNGWSAGMNANICMISRPGPINITELVEERYLKKKTCHSLSCKTE